MKVEEIIGYDIMEKLDGKMHLRDCFKTIEEAENELEFINKDYPSKEFYIVKLEVVK